MCARGVQSWKTWRHVNLLAVGLFYRGASLTSASCRDFLLDESRRSHQRDGKTGRKKDRQAGIQAGRQPTQWSRKTRSSVATMDTLLESFLSRCMFSVCMCASTSVGLFSCCHVLFFWKTFSLKLESMLSCFFLCVFFWTAGTLSSTNHKYMLQTETSKWSFNCFSVLTGKQVVSSCKSCRAEGFSRCL